MGLYLKTTENRLGRRAEIEVKVIFRYKSMNKTILIHSLECKSKETKQYKDCLFCVWTDEKHYKRHLIKNQYSWISDGELNEII